MVCMLKDAWSLAGIMVTASAMLSGASALALAEFSSPGCGEMPGSSCTVAPWSTMSKQSPELAAPFVSTYFAPKTWPQTSSGERSVLINSDGAGEKQRKRGAIGFGAALWLHTPECRLEMRAQHRLHRLGPFLQRLRARLRGQLVKHGQSLHEH